MRGESGKGDEEETVEDKELVTSLLNEWSAGGTNALSLNIEESDAQRYTRIIINMRGKYNMFPRSLILGLCLECETFIRGVFCPNLCVSVCVCVHFFEKKIIAAREGRQ